jgi:hypothetical protein
MFEVLHFFTNIFIFFYKLTWQFIISKMIKTERSTSYLLTNEIDKSKFFLLNYFINYRLSRRFIRKLVVVLNVACMAPSSTSYPKSQCRQIKLN